MHTSVCKLKLSMMKKASGIIVRKSRRLQRHQHEFFLMVTRVMVFYDLCNSTFIYNQALKLWQALTSLVSSKESKDFKTNIALKTLLTNRTYDYWFVLLWILIFYTTPHLIIMYNAHIILHIHFQWLYKTIVVKNSSF